MGNSISSNLAGTGMQLLLNPLAHFKEKLTHAIRQLHGNGNKLMTTTNQNMRLYVAISAAVVAMKQISKNKKTRKDFHTDGYIVGGTVTQGVR